MADKERKRQIEEKMGQMRAEAQAFARRWRQVKLIIIIITIQSNPFIALSLGARRGERKLYSIGERPLVVSGGGIHVLWFINRVFGHNVFYKGTFIHVIGGPVDTYICIIYIMHSIDNNNNNSDDDNNKGGEKEERAVQLYCIGDGPLIMV